MPRNPSLGTGFVDPETGQIAAEWLRYLISLGTNGPFFDQRIGPPPKPAEADSYYDLTLHKARTWDGTTWQNWW